MDEETPQAGHEHEPEPDGSASGVDLTDTEGYEMAELLDRLPGARERIERGIEDAREGRTIPLDEL
jgi:hypothetical protein